MVVCMPLVLRVTALMAGWEYGCVGCGWVMGSIVGVGVGCCLFVVLWRGVTGVFVGLGCCSVSLLVWSGLEV